MPFTREGLLTIKSEITTDPTVIGYAGKTDSQVAGLLNLPRVQSAVQGPIPPSRFMFYLVRVGKWNAVLIAISQVAKDLADYLRSHIEPIDAAPVGTILDGLVTATVITAADKTAILALGQTIPLQSRLQVLFDVNVGVAEATDVAAARVAV